jgi:hypothetical protein
MSNNDSSTISIEQKSFDYWRGQVDTVLKDIAGKMDRVNETLAVLNEWRSDIRSRIDLADQRITQHDQVLSDQARVISDLADTTQKMVGIVDQISKTITAPQIPETKTNTEGNSLTFKWITEKFGVPIVVAAISFFLFTIMPSVLVLIYILPKLMEQPVP